MKYLICTLLIMFISCNFHTRNQLTKDEIQSSTIIDLCGDKYTYYNLVRDEIIVIEYIQPKYSYGLVCYHNFIIGKSLDDKYIGVVLEEIADSLQLGNIARISPPSLQVSDICNNGKTRPKSSELNYINLLFCLLDTVYYADLQVIYK